MLSFTTIKYIAIALIFVLLVGSGWIAHGWKDQRDTLQGIVANTKAAETVTDTTQATVSHIDSKYTEELANAKKTIDDLNARLADGKLRLSAKTKCGVPAQPNDPGVDNGETRSDIDPATSRSLVAITSEGDDAITQLNACQDILAALPKSASQ